MQYAWGIRHEFKAQESIQLVCLRRWKPRVRAVLSALTGEQSARTNGNENKNKIYRFSSEWRQSKSVYVYSQKSPSMWLYGRDPCPWRIDAFCAILYSIKCIYDTCHSHPWLCRFIGAIVSEMSVRIQMWSFYYRTRCLLKAQLTECVS